MLKPEHYARRAVANWTPAPSPRCLSDLEAMAREVLLDAADEVSECEDIPAAMALLRRAAGGEV
jgi:hypothetical protein